MTLSQLVIAAYKKHMSGPNRLNKYYEKCLEQYPGKKAYCSRVSWRIFCSHVDPNYEGCSTSSKEVGPPYSGPLSKKK